MTRSIGLVLITTVGLSTRALGQRPDPTRVMDSIMGTIRRAGAPGCAVGVIRDGRFVYRGNAGLANLERGTPIGARTAFYMASVSKQFGAAAVALASLQGKLSLDDDIRKYLPELPGFGAPITVRHLIHHTSGIRDYLMLQTLAGRLADPASDSAVIALIGRQRSLGFPVGTEYSYSNSGYMLLSVIVERATGMSLREYAEREIFGPLGMTDTYFYDDHTRAHQAGDRRALGYFPGPDGFRSGVLANFEQVGDGGLFSTVEDMAKWNQNFVDGKVGGPRFLELIQTPGKLADGKPLDYAFGLMIRDYGGLKIVGHSGVFQGYRTMFQRFPAEGLAVVLLCNLGTIGPEELVPVIADAFLADRLDEAQRPIVGSYWSDELQVEWRITADRGRLMVDRGGPPVALRSQGADQYGMDTQLGRAIVKVVREGGRVVGLETGLGPRTSRVQFVKR
jgi:CubicO group peptidase (beta-lactamase class C family)